MWVVALRLLVAVCCFAAPQGLQQHQCQQCQQLVEADAVSDALVDSQSNDPGYDEDSSKDAALDLAIADVVQELHPVELPPTRSLVDRRIHAGRATVFDSNRSRNYPLGMKWHYGAHHKAGTNLLRSLAEEHASRMETESCISRGKYGWTPPNCIETRRRTAQVWFWCNLSTGVIADIERKQDRFMDDFITQNLTALARQSHADPPVRMVHMMRDPISMVISGYLYHMHSDDTPRPLLPIRNMSMMDALATEARFVIDWAGKEMLRVYTTAPPWVMHVRYEALTRSSESFDETVAAIYKYMLGDIYTEAERPKLLAAAANHDLRRSRQDDKNGHVGAASMKDQVRGFALRIPPALMDELKSLRRALGYCSKQNSKYVRSQDFRAC